MVPAVTLLGRAALAMWWDVSPDVRAEFEDWHSHEHFPERLGVPGFRRASRWSSAEGGEGFFVLYELDDHAVLASAAYAARLNAPTPWSARLMPHHRDMIRSQCRMLESRGAATASHALTVRCSPGPGDDGRLREGLAGLSRSVWMRPGMTGMHVLRHESPGLARTTEQAIRVAADRVADWVVVVVGYDEPTLRALGDGELSGSALSAMGAATGSQRHLYRLSFTATPADVVGAEGDDLPVSSSPSTASHLDTPTDRR